MGVASFSPDQLPAPISPIVGRDVQIARATNILVDQGVRLLTLTGPGGIGKTRFAFALAHSLTDWLPGGVAVVGLESVGDPTLVAPAMARAVGILDKSGDSEADLIRWFSVEERLILLDNFEQVFDAAPFLQRLLESCPGIRLIVTSRRAPLYIEGERILELGPLRFPRDPEAVQNLDRSQYPAVEFFLQHAPSVDWNVSWRAVTRICHRLDGIPLALELAGARVGLLSVDEIAEQTTGWMSILTMGRRNAPERHRTMEKTIEWSYRLLDEPLRQVMRSLGCFSGGFSREAAIEISLASQGQLTTLIESKLLTVSTSKSRDPRFRLLEPVRDFALQEAEREGETQELRSKLGEWAVQLARSIHARPFDPRIYTSEGVFLEQLIQRERANLLQALTWTVDAGDVRRSQTIATILADYWYLTMQPGEGRKWLTQVLELPRNQRDEHTQEYVKLCLGCSLLSLVAGNNDEGLTWAMKAHEIATAMNDTVAIAEAHGVLGYIYLNLGDFRQSIAVGSEALYVFSQPEFEDRPWQVDILENLALAALQIGEIERAATLVQDAVALSSAMDATIGYATAQRAMGDVRCHQGRFHEAIDAHSEGFAAGVRRHGRSSPETWHNIAQGMAGAATIAWFAFSDEPSLAISLVEKTERICHRLGMSKPDNRIDYQIIRDQMRIAGFIGVLAPTDLGAAGDLPSALQELREIASDLLKRLASGDKHALGMNIPPWEREFHDRSAELSNAISNVQLTTITALVQGRSVKEIAAADGVRQTSVYSRLEVIKAKWNLPPSTSLLELAVFAARHGVA